MKRFAVLASIMAASPAWAAPSHCQPGEKVAFSCQFKNGKMVSVCSAGGGRAVYRFGKPGGVELTFPSSGPATGWYEYMPVPFSKGVSVFFKFTQGAHAFEITETINHSLGQSDGDLTVTRGGKEILSLTCQRTHASQWDDAGLIETEP